MVPQYFWKKMGRKPSGPSALRGLKDLTTNSMSAAVRGRNREVTAKSESMMEVGGKGRDLVEWVHSVVKRETKWLRIRFLSSGVDWVQLP